MAVARALRRLLRVLELEEEQRKNALEAAVGELRRIEQAQAATVEREHRGRALVLSSFRSGEIADRIAGTEETRSALHLGEYLVARRTSAEAIVSERRAELVAKRIERKQTETLVEEAARREAQEQAHRAQSSLDEWYLSKQRRNQAKSNVESAGFRKS